MKAFRFAFTLFSFFLMLTGADLYAQSPSDLMQNPVFKNDCAKCHGKTAEGRHFAGPSLISDKTRAASDDELREIITNGKGRMPKFGGKLTPQEIDTLVTQIKALNKK
ncbi:MAG: hypothetical protein JWQ87_3648 [Candidatus Sulfotelmatobacter sp.]|nr:hypothetical protein [Candidatus Sulfotelmatobacter sp.]